MFSRESSGAAKLTGTGTAEDGDSALSPESGKVITKNAKPINNSPIPIGMSGYGFCCLPQRIFVDKALPDD
jgi:hypothetical protein